MTTTSLAHRALAAAPPILLHQRRTGVSMLSVSCPPPARMIGYHIEDVSREEMQRRYTKLLAGG